MVEEASLAAQPGSAGTALPTVAHTINQDQLNAYADAAGDHNPIHLDEDFAAATQFGGIIAHGMLTLAFVSEMLTEAFGRDWLESGSLKARFKGAAYLGDEVETWGKVSRQESTGNGHLVTCSVGLKKRGDGQEIISGTATVKVTAKVAG